MRLPHWQEFSPESRDEMLRKNRVVTDLDDVEALRRELFRYYWAHCAEGMQIEELYADAEGLEEGPYGYPTGEHTNVTMMAEICRKYKDLRGAIQSSGEAMMARARAKTAAEVASYSEDQ